MFVVTEGSNFMGINGDEITGGMPPQIQTIEWLVVALKGKVMKV